MTNEDWTKPESKQKNKIYYEKTQNPNMLHCYKHKMWFIKEYGCRKCLEIKVYEK